MSEKERPGAVSVPDSAEVSTQVSNGEQVSTPAVAPREPPAGGKKVSPQAAERMAAARRRAYLAEHPEPAQPPPPPAPPPVVEVPPPRKPRIGAPQGSKNGRFTTGLASRIFQARRHLSRAWKECEGESTAVLESAGLQDSALGRRLARRLCEGEYELGLMSKHLDRRGRYDKKGIPRAAYTRYLDTRQADLEVCRRLIDELRQLLEKAAAEGVGVGSGPSLVWEFHPCAEVAISLDAAALAAPAAPREPITPSPEDLPELPAVASPRGDEEPERMEDQVSDDAPKKTRVRLGQDGRAIEVEVGPGVRRVVDKKPWDWN